MSEPISFSAQLRAWRQRKQDRSAAIVVDGAEPAGNLVPFRQRAAAGSPDHSKADTPWLDWLRPIHGCRSSRISTHAITPWCSEPPASRWLWAN